MKRAGVNLVTLGVFSWAKLQPNAETYAFEWLDRVIGLLQRNEIFIDLATATASPPPWLTKLHPESLPMTANGARYSPGARQHYCPNSAAYRDYVARLVRQLAIALRPTSERRDVAHQQRIRSAHRRVLLRSLRYEFSALAPAQIQNP
jgi:beta-galactosidase